MLYMSLQLHLEHWERDKVLIIICTAYSRNVLRCKVQMVKAVYLSGGLTQLLF